MLSLVIPVCRNEESIAELLETISALKRELAEPLEVVFVVDGSPDASAALLRERLPRCGFRSQLVRHSRNFGSFQAVRTGLENATGKFFAVIAADLQEPMSLVKKMSAELASGADIVVGTRESRQDPFLKKIAAALFWKIYRRFVQPEMPPGGVDVFACNKVVRDRLLALDEANSTLVGLLIWLGFDRRSVPYERLARKRGKSAWSLSRKMRYLFDSVFAFSDLPIQLMIFAGFIGLGTALVLGGLVLAAKLSGSIPVPGYAATVLTVLFFGALNSLCLGIIGSYVWRAFENTKRRPGAYVLSRDEFNGAGA